MNTKKILPVVILATYINSLPIVNCAQYVNTFTYNSIDPGSRMCVNCYPDSRGYQWEAVTYYPEILNEAFSPGSLAIYIHPDHLPYFRFDFRPETDGPFANFVSLTMLIKFSIIAAITPIIVETHTIPNDFLLRLLSQSECTNLFITKSIDFSDPNYNDVVFITAEFGDNGLVQFGITNDVLVTDFIQNICRELNAINREGAATATRILTDLTSRLVGLYEFSNLTWRILLRTYGLSESIASLPISTGD